MSVAAFVAPTVADAVTRTRTWSPLLMAPGAPVNAPPLMEYWPPATDTGAPSEIPATVTAAESTDVPGGPLLETNANAEGSVSAVPMYQKPRPARVGVSEGTIAPLPSSP